MVEIILLTLSVDPMMAMPTNRNGQTTHRDESCKLVTEASSCLHTSDRCRWTGICWKVREGCAGTLTETVISIKLNVDERKQHIQPDPHPRW